MLLIGILIIFIIVAWVLAHDFEKEPDRQTVRKTPPVKPLLKKEEVFKPSISGNKTFESSFNESNFSNRNLHHKKKKPLKKEVSKSLRGVSMKEAVVLQEILQPPYLKDFR